MVALHIGALFIFRGMVCLGIIDGRNMCARPFIILDASHVRLPHAPVVSYAGHYIQGCYIEGLHLGALYISGYYIGALHTRPGPSVQGHYM